MKIIPNIEKLILTVILGMIAPILGLLSCWWGVLLFLPQNLVPFAALTGLILGLIADGIFLKQVVHHAHQMDIRIWVAIHLFYSVGVLGFFMGVPVFNAFLAIPAGFVIGARLAYQSADDARLRAATRQTCIITTIILTLVCIASAFIALASPSTPADLEGMLGLRFAITQAMLRGIILLGGLGLLVVNWLLADFSVRFTYRFLERLP